MGTLPFLRISQESPTTVGLSMSTVQPSLLLMISFSISLGSGTPTEVEETRLANSWQRLTTTTASATRSTGAKSQPHVKSNLRIKLVSSWARIYGVRMTLLFLQMHRVVSLTRSTGFGIGPLLQVLQAFPMARPRFIPPAWISTSRVQLLIKLLYNSLRGSP